MEANTQPVLCCLGDSVAGKPTQFLMERQFAALGLDWRAMTAEVSPEDVHDALSGVRALKFQAVRFFPTLSRRVPDVFFPGEPAAAFIGEFTSAALNSAGWQGWHHLGFGIGQRIGQQTNWSNCVCWLHGDSIRTRSMYVASSDFPSKLVVWTDAPENIPETVAVQRPIETQELVAVVDRMDSVLAPEDGIALIAEPESLTPEVVDVVERLLQSHRVMMSVPGETSDALHDVQERLVVVAEDDVLIACDEYDFERWTHRRADSSLFREALDEYCDF